MKTIMLLLISLFFLTGCDAIIDAFTKEPDVILTYQDISRVKTGEYQWIYCDSLPSDAVSGISHGERWYVQVPLYELYLYSSVKNRGDDGAGNVTGRVMVYADGAVVEKLTINYAALLYPGESVDVRKSLSTEYYDDFYIEISYWDADTEEYEEDCCDCCDCY
jgi:hypothetical protein